MPKQLLILPVLICLFRICRAQDSLISADKAINFPSSFFTKDNKQIAVPESRLTRQTSTCLQRLAKRGKKLQRKLSKVDAAAAQLLFANNQPQYTELYNRVTNNSHSGGGQIMQASAWSQSGRLG